MHKKFLKRLMAFTLAGCLVMSAAPGVAFSDAEGETPTVPIAAETTVRPTAEPAQAPAPEPTAENSAEPMPKSAAEPTAEPVIEEETSVDSEEPTAEPTAAPVTEPNIEPTAEPTAEPAAEPTAAPTAAETTMPAVADVPMIAENVQAVQKQIDALPAVDALNEENMAAAYAQTEAAYIAYLALPEDVQAQITGAEKFAALFAVFNAQVETLDSETGTHNISISSISISADDEEISIAENKVEADHTIAADGERVTLTISSASRYALYSLTVDGKDVISSVSGGTYSFDMPDHNVEISATFKATYQITVSTIGNGTGTVRVTDKQLPATNYKDLTTQFCGAAFFITMIPDSGCTLKSLTVKCDGKTDRYEGATLTQTCYYSYYKFWQTGRVTASDIEFEVEFVKTYAININVTEATNGTITIYNLENQQTNETSAAADATIKVTSEGEENYTLGELSVTDEQGNAIEITAHEENYVTYHTFTMPACGITITPTFKPQRGFLLRHGRSG